MEGVAVVILNWNGEGFLRRFLGGVVQSVAGVAEVVVADNGSTDGSVGLVRAAYPSVHVVELAENYGFAEGYNRALHWVREHLNSSVYVLLNSDVETRERWLEPLLARMERDASVWVVQPKIMSYAEPGRFEYAGACGGYLDALGYPFCRGRVLDYLEEDRGQYDNAVAVHWASGACMVVRADAYWRAGGLEGRFFAHMEEIDFCWRVRRLGGQVWVEPASRVWHVGGGALPNESPHKLYLNYRNSLWMLCRNLPFLRRCVLLPFRFALDWGSLLVYFFRGERAKSLAVLRAYRDALLYWGGMRHVRYEGERRVHLWRGSVVFLYRRVRKGGSVRVHLRGAN